VKHPAAYAERIQLGASPALERELVDEDNRKVEKVMLETRLAEGVDLAWLKEHGFGKPEVIAGLVADELLVPSHLFEGRLMLTVKGRLLADLVIRKLLGF
jgi:oxygen-independent coproporphyrinogen-3 oxidase